MYDEREQAIRTNKIARRSLLLGKSHRTAARVIWRDAKSTGQNPLRQQIENINNIAL
jgi:hypothetical protein